MDPEDVFTFVFFIVLVTTAGRVLNTWIRARHGLPVGPERHELRAQRRSERRMNKMQRRFANSPFAPVWMQNGDDQAEGTTSDARKIELLSSENERLTGQVSRLEERLRVLERIATDPAERTAREIDALRQAD